MRKTIERRTGTYADALAAIGLANLLAELGFGDPMIEAAPGEFVIQSPLDLPPQEWNPPGPGYPYIWERSKESQHPPMGWVLDYESARQQKDAWTKFQESAKKSKRKNRESPEAVGLEAPEPPPPDLGPALILASMRKGWNADRDLAKWISDRPVEVRRWVAWALGFGDGQPVEVPRVSNSQVLNPISGKGVHAPKTELRSPGSLPAQLMDPFREWMKLRGLWTGMLLYRSGDDFKFFAIEPAQITAEGVKLVRQELARLNLWGGVKLDILATLRCTQALLEHSDVVQGGSEGRIGLRRLTPRSVIAGLRQAYFKSLGTAPALMNDALLPLPDWFVVDTREDAEDYLAIIEETIGGAQDSGCLGWLRDDRSDEGQVLQQYRQWLLTGDAYELLAFHYQFALKLMEKYGSKDYCRPYRTEILDKLLGRAFPRLRMKTIIANEGFLSVSRAIRNTTIYAASLPNSRREVRFGLAQRWKQSLKAGKKEFLTELSEFVQAQNWEVIHRLKGQGHVVSTEDLNAVVDLVESHGAELVGSLLLAYGYSRAPKVDSEASDSANAL